MTSRFRWIALCAGMLTVCAQGHAVSAAPKPNGARALRGGRVAPQRPLGSASENRARRNLALVSSALTELAGGVENALQTDAPGVTERLYVLEMKAIEALKAIANLPPQKLADGARAELMEEGRAIVRRVLHQKDHVVGPHAIKAVRAAIPGEPMAKLHAHEGRDLYELLDRSDSMSRTTSVAPRTRAELYEERLRQFLASGGRMSDIVPLSAEFLDTVPSGAMITWAQRQSDKQIWVSTTAKHIVTAGGEPSFGAGEMKVYKDRRGKVFLALLSNASGGVKSGPGSLEAPAAELVSLGVPSSQLLLTAHSPADPQLLKLLLISDRSLTPEQISQRMKRALALAISPERMASP